MDQNKDEILRLIEEGARELVKLRRQARAAGADDADISFACARGKLRAMPHPQDEAA